MSIVTWWRTRVWRWQSGLVLASLLLAGSALTSSITNFRDEPNEHANDRANRQQIAFLRAELECRSEIGAETSNLEGRINRETALGLVDVARSDEAALAARADVIERLATELGPALQRRAEAVEHCEQVARRGR
jgi:hypothetical protein